MDIRVFENGFLVVECYVGRYMDHLWLYLYTDMHLRIVTSKWSDIPAPKQRKFSIWTTLHTKMIIRRVDGSVDPKMVLVYTFNSIISTH